MEVTLDIPFAFLAFSLIISAVVMGKCIQKAHAADLCNQAFGGFFAGAVVSVASTLVFGGHFVYLFNSVVCKLTE